MGDPASAVELADSVGLALLVVLETLNPVERLAFVLHDLFAVPFDEIAPIVGRSPAAARQLASRARRRVQSDSSTSEGATARHRKVVEAFLAASRDGEFEALLTLLDPDVVMRVDDAGQRLGAPPETRGRDAVAAFFSGRARTAEPALVDGAAGAVVRAGGRTRIVISFIIVDGTIIGLEAVADPDVIRDLDLNVR